jgi:hypothetical protein
MSSSAHADARSAAEESARAVAARIEGEQLRVETADGRTLVVPIARFPWLAQASPAQRAGLQIYGGGYVLLWDELDEGVSVLQLLGLPH